MRKITKLFTSKSVSVNEKERTAQFIISDDQVDRMDEIVEQSWDTENYKNNPIVSRRARERSRNITRIRDGERRRRRNPNQIYREVQ